MLKASELKNEQLIRRVNTQVDYSVVSNHKGDCLFLCNLESEFYDGFHLFYDSLEDVVFAADAFGIDLS